MPDFTIRPAQAEMLRTYYSRIDALQKKQQKAIQKLITQFNEALYFIKRDLGVPVNEPYNLAPDFSKFVELPKESKPHLVADNSHTVEAPEIALPDPDGAV